jgi:hypothetical protein
MMLLTQYAHYTLEGVKFQYYRSIAGTGGRRENLFLVINTKRRGVTPALSPELETSRLT